MELRGCSPRSLPPFIPPTLIPPSFPPSLHPLSLLQRQAILGKHRGLQLLYRKNEICFPCQYSPSDGRLGLASPTQTWGCGTFLRNSFSYPMSIIGLTGPAWGWFHEFLANSLSWLESNKEYISEIKLQDET